MIEKDDNCTRLFCYKWMEGEIQFMTFNKEDCPPKIWDAYMKSHKTFSDFYEMINKIYTDILYINMKINEEIKKHNK